MIGEFDKRWFWLIPILIVYGIGMFIDVMAVDAAQYAQMSMEIERSNDFLHFYYHGQDYIDKPPFLFWITVLSFKLFGVSTFTYKLPSVLFCLLGLYATYRLARSIYNEKVALYATLILATSQAWFLSNHDIKTDTILAASIIYTLWQLVEFEETKSLLNIVGIAIGIAISMLTKGPIGIVMPLLGFGSHLILRRRWKLIFRIEWLLLIPLVVLFLLPMLYGLYTQFDETGGKDTYNGFISSGLRFYFWTQSFGRITGESSWHNDTDAFFFVHTFLWAILPWSLLYLFAASNSVKKLWKREFHLRQKDEALTLGGVILPLIAFSLSKYKLPHYIFVVVPLASIATAAYVHLLVNKAKKKQLLQRLVLAQNLIVVILLSVVTLLYLLIFPISNVVVAICAACGIILTVVWIFRHRENEDVFNQLLAPCLVGAITVNFLLNVHVYPELLKYQAGSVAGRYVTGQYDRRLVATYKIYSDTFDFSTKGAGHRIESIDSIKSVKGGAIVYTTPEGYAELKDAGIIIREAKVFDDFHVSTLNFRFLNPSTRRDVLSKKYLLLID